VHAENEALASAYGTQEHSGHAFGVQGHDTRYDVRHHRGPWMSSASGTDRVSRNHSSLMSQQFSVQGYNTHVPQSYSSSWSSSSASSLGSQSSGYSRQLPSYDTLYVQAQADEEYGTVEYGKR
jgi:hypothetical protein